MNAAQRERVKKLIYVLEHFNTERHKLVRPVNDFDMQRWHCGTAACAAGTAMLHPWFIAKGFKAEHSWSNPAPVYQDVDGSIAISTFFGLSADDVGQIFYSNNVGYPPVKRFFGLVSDDRITPKRVAKKLREVLQRG